MSTLKPYWADGQITLHLGDCRDVLPEMEPGSVDAIVTDPPYDLTAGKKGGTGDASLNTASPAGRSRISTGGGFMGKDWDATGVAFDPATWRAALRVLKPGGHLLAFGGTRTWHRMVCAIEDAGFEIRDSMHWLYATGFPKSLDVSKAIDKAAGAPRELLSEGAPVKRMIPGADQERTGSWIKDNGREFVPTATAPATDAACQWSGWGTALKPAHEPVVCARKPFSPVSLDWRLVANVHHALSGLLWLSLSPARRAEPSSPSRSHEPGAAWCASARVSVALGTSPGPSGETATYNSRALESMCSNIVRSWSAILAALSAPTKTSTISTASSTTTALRTLNSLLAPITSQTTMPPCACLLGGDSSVAPSADSSSSAGWANWIGTLSHSVPETATEGIALAVSSALASIAADLSSDLAAESSAQPGATPSTGDSTGDGIRSRTDESGNAQPSHEPITVARKPLTGTVSQNVIEHGTGALNIAGCRVAVTAEDVAVQRARTGGVMGADDGRTIYGSGKRLPAGNDAGRWPPNVLLGPDAAAELDRQSGHCEGGHRPARRGGIGYGSSAQGTDDGVALDYDSGGASRFFPVFRYEPKAGSAERPRGDDGTAHPTVKPVDLMAWLVRLVTPPGGLVRDFFAGSGTTAEACIVEGFRCVLIEKDPAYAELIRTRLRKPIQPAMFGGEVA